MGKTCPRCGLLRVVSAQPCACGYKLETAFTPVLEAQTGGAVRPKSSEPEPAEALESLPTARHWLAQLGVQLGASGIFLALGGLAGVVSAFLPVQSATAAVFGHGSFGSTMVVEDWRGMVGLIGYGLALVLTIVLYPARGLPAKVWGWAGLGVGTLVVLMAGWLLHSCLAGSVRDGVPGLITIEVKPGIGAFLNVLSATAVATGAGLRAVSVFRASQ